MPILKTRDALKQMEIGQTLEMTSDDPASEADMQSWTARTGHELLETDKDGAVFRFVVADDSTNARLDLTVTLRRRTSTSMRCSLPSRSVGDSSTATMY